LKLLLQDLPRNLKKKSNKLWKSNTSKKKALMEVFYLLFSLLLNSLSKGGLSREWFTLISKEIFDPKFGLFRYSTNGMSIQPSPSSRLIPSHLKYMEFAGMLIAKVLFDSRILTNVSKRRYVTRQLLMSLSPNLSLNISSVNFLIE